MIKHRFFINRIDKEEAWVENYRRQGYRLENVKVSTGRYEFIRSEVQGTIPKVRIDYRVFNKWDQYEDYLTLFEDCGWKHIGGTKTSGVQYFEQTVPSADDEIFSDSISKAERYKRIAYMWFHFSIMYIPMAVALQTTGAFDFKKILHLKDLYYTPGLWNMEGVHFWRAFLFETPFAVIRGFGGFLFLLLILMYAWFGSRSLYWYVKEKKNCRQKINGV